MSALRRLTIDSRGGGSCSGSGGFSGTGSGGGGGGSGGVGGGGAGGGDGGSGGGSGSSRGGGGRSRAGRGVPLSQREYESVVVRQVEKEHLRRRSGTGERPPAGVKQTHRMAGIGISADRTGRNRIGGGQGRAGRGEGRIQLETPVHQAVSSGRRSIEAAP